MDNGEIDRRYKGFEEARHEEGDVEWWSARDLMVLLGYTQWRNFESAVKKAMQSCESSERPAKDHFAKVSKMVSIGSGAERQVDDYILTRYACYLVAMNGDVRKPEIAFAQAYFLVQTRRAELIAQRLEEVRRVSSRDNYTLADKYLSDVMFTRGLDGRAIARVKSRGDEALFGGRNTKEMKRLLGVSLKKPLADVLPEVLITGKALADSMTAYNAEKNDIRGEMPFTDEHVTNNSTVRSALVSRGIVPEELPAEEDTSKLKRRIDRDTKKIGDGSILHIDAEIEGLDEPAE